MAASVRTRVALKIGIESKIKAELLSFNKLNTDKEHIAFVFNQADKLQEIPLVRVHSECLTGDIFHSSRCDCGEQLNETIKHMAVSGGILLYLRQEGRGIGLYNKIDAYALQNQGMDTYQANNHLGFDDDLRDFIEAVQMLEALNISKIKLLTNNPKKINELREHGIEICEVINTQTHIKDDNLRYLKAKAQYGNHSLRINQLNN